MSLFSSNISLPLLPFVPVGAAPHVEFDTELVFKRATCYDSCLVQGSVINSLFEREASLTNHKAARIAAKFMTSGEMRKSAFGNRMLMKRILSGMLEGGEKIVCG